MSRLAPTRIVLAVTATLCLGITMPLLGHAQGGPNFVNSPRPAKAHPSHNRGEHLNEWMERHSNLSPERQQKALEAEPGFSRLPQAVQQRELARLAKLNAMPSQKRQRLLQRNEWMEHLTGPQREQVRAAMKQLAALPPDQRRYVDRTFYGLRELPPQQRRAVLNSERYSNLTEAQRASLNQLLQIEPLIPPPYSGPAPGRPQPLITAQR